MYVVTIHSNDYLQNFICTSLWKEMANVFTISYLYVIANLSKMLKKCNYLGTHQFYIIYDTRKVIC